MIPAMLRSNAGDASMHGQQPLCRPAKPARNHGGAVNAGGSRRRSASRGSWRRLGTSAASCYRAAPMPTAVLRRSVAQLFMVGLPGPTLDAASRAFLAEHPPGGVILFKRNVRSAAQLRRLTAALHATGAGIPPLVALDHEGGRVHR